MNEYSVSKSDDALSSPGEVTPAENYIVAIGASAGGLEAIHAFFDHLNEANNLAFIIIQHLSPDYKSLLVELVAKHTHLSVYEAVHDTEVKPNCIYVIPPRKLMTISDGRLQLSEKTAGDKGPNTAIDTFLHTLAIEKGEKAIAVILSGTGTDGTRGAETIKNSGGVVIVQDPGTAKFDGMPRSAAAQADFVLSPEQMPGEIYNHIQEIPSNIFKKGKIDEHLLQEIFQLIFKHTGCDFHYYKFPTLLRRISRRMMIHGYQIINDYIDYLKAHPEECKILCKDFLIGVTRFFRDQRAFEILNTRIIPSIVDSKEEGEILKVWICACSSGEEAYSIAILINEYLQRKGKQLNVKIFATDIDATAIEKAAKGYFSSSIAKDMEPDILNKYFTREGRRYCVIPAIRKQIVFARHNIISDPPFIKNDLVTCRNMLIYMNSSLQKKILSTLVFSINKGGYLFLGSSETISIVKENLEEIDRKWKIYRKLEQSLAKSAGHQLKTEFPLYNTGHVPYDHNSSKIPLKGLNEELRETIIQEFGYAALYIDRNYEIKEAVGDFRRYISLPEHSLYLNIMKMIPIDLATSLGAGIRKAWKEEKKVVIPQVKIRDNQTVRNLSILIKPPAINKGVQYTLIVFGERESDLVKDAPEIRMEPSDLEGTDYLTEL
ncbi:MAG: chemotaxis protein, partial [Chitinophagaceae bacterium]